MSTRPKAVAVVSGGMDSITLLHFLEMTLGFETTLISFNYGQRHKKELDYAKLAAAKFVRKHHIVDLSNISELIDSSSLVNTDIDVPEGHYAAETMKSTVVPNRNAMMIAIATALAVNIGAEVVAVGVHSGDHAVYPDCREDFIQTMSAAMIEGNRGFGHEQLRVIAPFVRFDKRQIAMAGVALGVDFTQTWSCYKGGEFQCGRCSTDLERIEALALAGSEDPTEYADMDWANKVRQEVLKLGHLPSSERLIEMGL